MTPHTTAATRYGPASGGRPSDCAHRPLMSSRLGPATAPMVAPHTTMDKLRARRFADARSVAAYRACKPAAEATPTKRHPAYTIASERYTAPAMTMIDPREPRKYPPASAARRPRERATRASGSASSAAPTTPNVWASPAAASLPLIDSAIRAPAGSEPATATPPRT